MKNTRELKEKRIFGRQECFWCGKFFDGVLASCGTGYTWFLFKCPHCNKLTATGRIIPIEVKNDTEIRLCPQPKEIKVNPRFRRLFKNSKEINI